MASSLSIYIWVFTYIYIYYKCIWIYIYIYIYIFTYIKKMYITCPSLWVTMEPLADWKQPEGHIVCLFSYMYIFTYIYIYMCVCVCVCVCVWVCVCVFIYSIYINVFSVNIYICMHVYEIMKIMCPLHQLHARLSLIFNAFNSTEIKCFNIESVLFSQTAVQVVCF